MLSGLKSPPRVYIEKRDELRAAYLTGSGSAAAHDSAASKTQSDSALDWKAQKEEQARLRKRLNDLKKTEEAILNHETRMEEIDQLLASEEVYTNVSRLMELNQEKETLTRQLEELYEAWESLAE